MLDFVIRCLRCPRFGVTEIKYEGRNVSDGAQDVSTLSFQQIVAVAVAVALAPHDHDHLNPVATNYLCILVAA